MESPPESEAKVTCKLITASDIPAIIKNDRLVSHRIPKAVLAQLDPDGCHITGQGILHDGGAYGVTTWRGQVLFKVDGTFKPAMVEVDIPLHVYNALPVITMEDLSESIRDA